MFDEPEKRRRESAYWFMPALGFGLAVLLAWGVGWTQGRDYFEPPNTRAVLEKVAIDQAVLSCGTKDRRQNAECVKDRIENAWQVAHDEQDLRAQQRSASSALATAIVSFLALIVTVIGVYFIKRTLDATLEAVEDTSRATKAMVRQNQLMEEAQRPWLTIKISKLGDFKWVSGHLRCDYSLQITNSGEAPAVIVSEWIGIFPRIGKRTFDRASFVADACKMLGARNQVVAPGATESFVGKEWLIDTTNVPQSGVYEDKSLPTLIVGVTYFGPDKSRPRVTAMQVGVHPKLMDQSVLAPRQGHITKTFMD